MMRMYDRCIGFRRAVAALAFVTTVQGCGATSAPPPPPAAPPAPGHQLDPDTSSVVAAFEKRLNEYLALHRKLEATLPKLSKNATPQEIDKNQRALGALLQSARKGAKQGEFFTRDMQGLVNRTLTRVFAGPDGKTLKDSIMDENPGLPKLSVNERYPDNVPLSTMPPEVLSALPKLDEDMEFRFVGDDLILFDAHAHLIVDFINNAMPV